MFTFYCDRYLPVAFAMTVRTVTTFLLKYWFPQLSMLRIGDERHPRDKLNTHTKIKLCKDIRDQSKKYFDSSTCSLALLWIKALKSVLCFIWVADMEELLQDIFKEATGPKLTTLRKTCQDALGNLLKCNLHNILFTTTFTA